MRIYDSQTIIEGGLPQLGTLVHVRVVVRVELNQRRGRDALRWFHAPSKVQRFHLSRKKPRSLGGPVLSATGAERGCNGVGLPRSGTGVWRLRWVTENPVWSQRGGGMGGLVVGVSANSADRVLRNGAGK